nr:hypothetical protein [uncultured Allobacillus sp.]
MFLDKDLNIVKLRDTSLKNDNYKESYSSYLLRKESKEKEEKKDNK